MGLSFGAWCSRLDRAKAPETRAMRATKLRPAKMGRREKKLKGPEPFESLLKLSCKGVGVAPPSSEGIGGGVRKEG